MWIDLKMLTYEPSKRAASRFSFMQFRLLRPVECGLAQSTSLPSGYTYINADRLVVIRITAFMYKSNWLMSLSLSYIISIVRETCM